MDYSWLPREKQSELSERVQRIWTVQNFSRLEDSLCVSLCVWVCVWFIRGVSEGEGSRQQMEDHASTKQPCFHFFMHKQNDCLSLFRLFLSRFCSSFLPAIFYTYLLILLISGLLCMNVCLFLFVSFFKDPCFYWCSLAWRRVCVCCRFKLPTRSLSHPHTHTYTHASCVHAKVPFQDVCRAEEPVLLGLRAPVFLWSVVPRKIWYWLELFPNI